MVGAKLYERGVSLPQVMTFLIASPWNSLSLTLILIALIGVKWTLVFIAASAVIAIISGFIFMALVKKGILPDNPNKPEPLENFNLMADAKQRLKKLKITPKFFVEIFTGGLHEAQMLLRWLLLGVIIAAAARSFIPHEIFAEWFGPTLFGLGMTLSFASQGAGRMKAPFYAGIARMIVATAGGWFAIDRLGLGLDGVFTAIAAGIVLFGSMIAGPLLIKPWGPKRQRSRGKLVFPTGATNDPPLDDRHLEPQPR